MDFKDFIQMDEVGTSTSCIAGFKRISIPLTRRIFPPEIGWIDPEEKKGKKNPYRVPQLEENFGAAMGAMGQGVMSQLGHGQQSAGQQNGSGINAQLVAITKQTAEQLSQFADQIEAQGQGSDKQLVTLIKTCSANHVRIADQFQQIENLMKQRSARQQQQQQQQTHTTDVASGINNLTNKITGIMGQGGALSRGQSTT